MQTSIVKKRPRRSLWRSLTFRVPLVAALSMALASIATPADAIINGEDLTNRADDYPWVAALINPGETNVRDRFYCSGFLVKPSWVVTAGHCSRELDEGDIVTIGRGRLWTTEGERREVAHVEYMTDREYYDYCPANLENRFVLCDIALVRLNAPSTKPDLDLAGQAEVSEWGAGKPARAYGYGRTQAGGIGILKRAHLHITSLRDNHYTLFARDTDFPITDAICFGDSGGPLIVTTSNGYRVVGVVRAVATDDDPAGCNPGVDQSYVKVGWRHDPDQNAQPWQWIADTI